MGERTSPLEGMGGLSGTAMERDVLVIGCGLSGSVIARHLAEQGRHVEIWERRSHIGGNMYDYVDEHGFLVQMYGPHIFHTNSEELYRYMMRFGEWKDIRFTYEAVLNGIYTPTPFNFTTIDTFYPPEKAARLKEKLQTAFAGRKMAPVMEVLQSQDEDIRGYAQFLFENDYAPYTAKQWNVSPDKIDPSILARVPLYFSYDADGGIRDKYQILPEKSFTAFFEKLLDHPNIKLRMGIEALEHLSARDGRLWLDGAPVDTPVVYTGALDELFGGLYGPLPYRSLSFAWKYSDADSFQPAPVVAYPQAEGYTRITEFKKLPAQQGKGTVYAEEYPIPYVQGRSEPYYPVLMEESKEQYTKYKALADRIPNLIYCGRLADFKYYFMDQALERALEVCKERL